MVVSVAAPQQLRRDRYNIVDVDFDSDRARVVSVVVIAAYTPNFDVSVVSVIEGGVGTVNVTVFGRIELFPAQ